MKQNKNLHVLLAGASGLVGGCLLQLLTESNQIEKIVLLSRKATKHSHPKITEYLVDFDAPNSYASLVIGDLVFCCLGTTIKVAGSQQNFIKVDCTYPIDMAKAAKANKVPAFHLVTALDANASSSIFYNRVKGQVQDAIAAIGFDVCCFYQPSMLLGERTSKRPAERVGQKMMVFLDFLIPARYKAISGISVAQAMLRLALTPKQGLQIIPSDELSKLARNA